MDKNALLAVFRDASNSGWSLRSDIQLQDWLEAFADHVKQRTESVIKEVEQLGTGAGEVELYLQNTSNSLRALSATQFIENRVDEADELPISKVEPQAKEPRGENYDTQIIPCYKEAVLTAWNAYEGFTSSKTRSSSTDVHNELARGPLATQRPKLPHIIGTDEFVRDSRCGLADMGFPIRNRGSSSSEPAETDSDMDKEETHLAAELVGGGLWLEDDWSATGSETSHHQQGGVLEPAVSAALDFKAMLEAALRGPSFPYEEGMLPNMENVYGQYSYMDNAPTTSAHEKMSNTSRMRSETGERELGGALPTTLESSVSDSQRDGSYLANNMESQDFETEHASPSNDSEYNTAAASSEQSSLNQNQAGNPTSSYHGSSLDPVHPYGDTSMRREQGPHTAGASKTHTPPAPNFTAPFRSDEINPQPPPLKLRGGVVTDSPAIPTLPDGLFQGLQAAIQAREKRSQSQNNEGTTDKEGILQKPNVSGKERTTVRMENPIAGRKSNLEDNRLLNKNITNETSLKLQKGSVKGVNSGPRSRPQKTISFQGGLFDDDDDDDLDNRVDVPKSGNDSEDKNGGFVKPIVDSQSHLMGSQASTFSTNKQGLLDDLSQISTGSLTQDVQIGKRPPALISSEEDSQGVYEGHDITHATTNSENIVEDQVDSGRNADVKSQRMNSQKLAVAVAAIREPIPSESSDTSLSWSDSGGGESSSENEMSISKSAGKQKIESSEARIVTFHQQSRLSGSSSKGDDGGKTTKIYQAKPTLTTTEEVREPAMNVTRLFVQTASDLPNTKGSPSLQLRTEADPSVSCMLDGAATMGRPHQDATEVSSSLMHYSSGRLQQDAPSTKEHQGDHSRSLSAPRNGVSNTSKLGVEASLASTQSPTQGGAGKNEKSPFSGVPAITSRRYRSLFDDDDDDDEDADLILPQSRGLLATESRIGASRSSTSFSSDRRQNSPPASPIAPGLATTTTSIHRRVFSESRSEISSQRPQSSSSPLSRVLNSSVSSSRNSEVAVSSPSPSNQEQARAAKASPRTVSALLFGDDDNNGEDSLFGPLGGWSRNKSSGLFDAEDTSEDDSFLQNVSAKLPLTSSLKASRTVVSSSERISRRSLFDDGGDDNNDAI